MHIQDSGGFTKSGELPTADPVYVTSEREMKQELDSILKKLSPTAEWTVRIQVPSPSPHAERFCGSCTVPKPITPCVISGQTAPVLCRRCSGWRPWCWVERQVPMDSWSSSGHCRTLSSPNCWTGMSLDIPSLLCQLTPLHFSYPSQNVATAIADGVITVDLK